MPDDVRDALKNVIIQEGRMGGAEADSYIREMDRKKRYQAETWA